MPRFSECIELICVHALGKKRKWVDDEDSALCECVVLPEFEFDRLHAAALAEKDASQRSSTCE